MNLSSRSTPGFFDVLLVVALDVRESPGLDIQSDLKNFLSKGLSVGLISLGQASRPNRYRNTPLVKMAFELGVPLLGHRDVCKTQLAIVYNPALFIARDLRGSFAAQWVWIVLDNEQFEKLPVDRLESKVASYCASAPVFMAATTAEQQTVRAKTGDYAGLWNFHAPDAGGEGPQAANAKSIPTRIGVPAMSKYSRLAIEDVKNLALRVGEAAGKALYARTRVPNQLQTGKGEADFLVGFPFVPRDRDKFLSSLAMYVVPTTMLGSGTWKDDVYACMRLGVPVGLPHTLQPYFGASASYFQVDASELFLEGDEATEKHAEIGKDSVKFARDLFKERTHSASNDSLLAFGVEPIIATKSSDSEGRTGETAVQLPVTSHKNPASRAARVCFVTSNGAGMGHLTRLLAVARRLDHDVEASFVSMSQACGVVAQYGYDFEYIASKGDLLADGAEWNQYFGKRFTESLQRINPDVVVFDGTWPYQGVAKAVTSYDAKFIWMRRGMWRSETATTSLVRNTAFDSVIEPGDVASPYDQGATSRAVDALKVDPIIVLDPDEILDRSQARDLLNMGPNENAMLITLGAGNINKIDADVTEVIMAVKSLPEPWRIFITSPLIADNLEVSDGVETISMYPLARVAKAFDFVVSATGYNSFHEWIAYSVPALWIANANTITDDQIGRARYAHDVGLGLAAGPGGSVSIQEAVERLGDASFRARFQEAMNEVSFPNGARSAARHISELAKG